MGILGRVLYQFHDYDQFKDVNAHTISYRFLVIMLVSISETNAVSYVHPEGFNLTEVLHMKYAA